MSQSKSYAALKAGFWLVAKKEIRDILSTRGMQHIIAVLKMEGATREGRGAASRRQGQFPWDS